MKWRWRPDKCELQRFNASRFLELVRGKSMAFVGDSLARNQMQSLLCLLSTVEYPTNISNRTPISKKFKRWVYKDTNFTIATFWTPYLIRANEDQNDKSHNRVTNLYLDEANSNWTSHMQGFDYVVISAGRWFFGPKMYYENDGRDLVGCHLCSKNDVKNYTMLYGYKRAFGTALEALFGNEGFRGEVFMRTISPAHFEDGEWNSGGECRRTKPLLRRRDVKKILVNNNWGDLELHRIGVEVFREVKKNGFKIRLLDVTKAMGLRADGHPNHYGHWPTQNVSVAADCVHWCLPGPIDTWNDFLLHLLKDGQINQ